MKRIILYLVIALVWSVSTSHFVVAAPIGVAAKDVFEDAFVGYFNGRFSGETSTGKVIELYLKDDGDIYTGKLLYNEQKYPIEAEMEGASLRGVAGTEESHFTFTFGKKSGVHVFKAGKENVRMQKISFPDIRGEWEGELVQLQINGEHELQLLDGKQAHKYTGQLELSGKKMKFSGIGKGWILDGVIEDASAAGKREFSLELDGKNLIFLSGTFMDELESLTDRYLEEARSARVEKDWETVKIKAEAVLLWRINSEVQSLKKEAEQCMKVEKYLKEARSAKEEKDWETVKIKAEAVLALGSNSEAQSLKNEAERQMLNQVVEKYLKEARSAKEEKDWETVKIKTEAVLALKSNSEAQSLKNEAERQEKIEKYLEEARNAKEQKDWETVKIKAEAVLALGSNSEAQSLKNEAERQVLNQAVENYLKEAQNAKEQKDWETVKIKAEAVLELGSNNEAQSLKDEAERQEKIENYLKEARSAKEQRDWKTVKIKAEAVLKLENNSEALSLKNEIEQDVIGRYLKEAQSAKEQGDWKTVKIKAEAVLELEGNSEAQSLKEEARSFLGKEAKDMLGERFSVGSLGKKNNLEMIWVNPGTFSMGSPEGELGRRGDETQHQVTLTTGFWLGKYEITQAQYQAVMEEGPDRSGVVAVGLFAALGGGAAAKAMATAASENKSKNDNLPVVVSWENAIKFCAKLTEIEKAAGRLPEGYEYTLPTEAQWEYACRAGTTTAFSNGTDIPKENQISDKSCPNINTAGWYLYNSSSKMHPVGKKKPNAWGFYDMHGNVWEWCLDRYDTEYGLTETELGDGVADPMGAREGSYRVLRGGSWGDDAGHCRSAERDYHFTTFGLSYGFRAALSPVQ